MGYSPRIIYPSRENTAGHTLLAFAHRGECRGIVLYSPSAWLLRDKYRWFVGYRKGLRDPPKLQAVLSSHSGLRHSFEFDSSGLFFILTIKALFSLLAQGDRGGAWLLRDKYRWFVGIDPLSRLRRQLPLSGGAFGRGAGERGIERDGYTLKKCGHFLPSA